MAQILRAVRLWWHIGVFSVGAVIGIGVWVDNVNSYESKIEANADRLAAMIPAVVNMNYNLQRIADLYGIEPLRRTEGLDGR